MWFDSGRSRLWMWNCMSSFVQGPKTGCEFGYTQPETAEECRAIAEAANVRYWGGSGHSSGADPRGCIYRTPDRDIYFNTHITGSTNRGDRRTVCVKSEVDTYRFTTSEPGQNCDQACGLMEEECVEDMLLLYSAEEVASWASAVGVTCTAIVDRCGIGESPIFNWRNGECTFCSNPNHPGWLNGNRCDD
eukprot:UN21917